MTHHTRIATLLIGCLFLGILFFHPIQAFNQDLGRHILLGNIILSTKSIPNINLISYTFPNFPFINHHYLAEIIYAITNTLGGARLLFILTILLMLATYSLLTLSRKATFVTSLLTLLFFLGLMVERTDIRPETFSYLFLSIFIVILFKNRDKKTKLLFLLPIVQLVWTNTHIYFPLGLAVAGLFLIEALLLHRKNLKSPDVTFLGITTLLCACAMVFNPHGVAGALYPFSVMNNYGYSIEENQTPFFLMSLGMQKTSFLALFLLQAVVWIGLLALRKKARVIDYLLAGFFTYLSLSAVRNIPLFAIALFPTVTHLLDIFFGRDIFTKKSRTIISLCLIAGLIIQASMFIRENGFGIKTLENGKKAVDFVVAHDIKGPIFNNFDVGSYLSYRLYPTERVFIDGRPEAYPADFIQKTYIPMQQDPRVFQTEANKYNINLIYFSHTDQTPWAKTFVASILSNPAFVPIYLDQDTLIMIRDAPANKALIQQYGLSRIDTRLTYSHAPDEEDLKKAANFYSITNQQRGLTDTLTALVAKSPYNCEYLGFLVPVLAQQQSAATGLYQAKYQTQCQ